MEDTSPETQKMIKELWLLKSDSEKIHITVEMFELFRTFVRSGILNEKPDISKKELEKEVFKRFYKNDFSESEMRKIVATF